MGQRNRLAILVGGGPAPGINSVIGAATIEAQLDGVEVLGVHDGFQWIMQGDITHITPLSIDVVSRIHFHGGSVIGISRANPTLEHPGERSASSPGTGQGGGEAPSNRARMVGSTA